MTVHLCVLCGGPLTDRHESERLGVIAVDLFGTVFAAPVHRRCKRRMQVARAALRHTERTHLRSLPPAS